MLVEPSSAPFVPIPSSEAVPVRPTLPGQKVLVRRGASSAQGRIVSAPDNLDSDDALFIVMVG